ncbi:CAMK protein kinase [Microbotryum lychnidis-dioicae p1A1 Lamole]|uniref:CAMK protein kinase n=1 Tax=Microbotryum lychnidis-dioicae (strain p1A1 Lamole / MvSl-1064) TaxID=683840 RepID=U5HI42_USTV1|nr:CAMK protein kinase [Microbotryum lychnidis-dioicae p1A1 Lamole]|eukprot:KDE02763.1 CAMK protein kinase [Microbotryum lychnidis-dioicae p1A1 Lamole]
MSAVDPSSSPPPGSVFHSHYQLEELIGSGGFGWVCRATRRADGRQVAIKLILKNRMARESIVRARWEASEGLDMWEDGTIVLPLEAYVLRQARHRGVVEYLDLFADDDYFYLVMEHHGSPWLKPSSNHVGEIMPIIFPPSPPLTPPTAFFPLHSLPSSSDIAAQASSPRSSEMMASSLHESPRISRPTPIRWSSALNSLSLTSLEPKPQSATMTRSMPMMRRSSSSDLFECIEQHSHFNEPTARFLFAQIVDAVYDLRKRGITHRDLKDENIVVDAAGCVKIIDFGSALHFRTSEPVPMCNRFFGTVSSASPETLDKEPYHPFPAEVWSLGVLLHILLTGSTPFPTRHHIRRAQRNRELNFKLSAAANNLLDQCFAVNVDERITLERLCDHPWMRMRS